MRTIIHLGNAGKGGLECGATAKTVKPNDLFSNWTWTPEKVTCKKCLAAYRRRAGARSSQEGR